VLYKKQAGRLRCEALQLETLIKVLDYALDHFQWVVQGNLCLATA